jgi:hypothetical protein
VALFSPRSDLHSISKTFRHVTVVILFSFSSFFWIKNVLSFFVFVFAIIIKVDKALYWLIYSQLIIQLFKSLSYSCSNYSCTRFITPSITTYEVSRWHQCWCFSHLHFHLMQIAESSIDRLFPGPWTNIESEL